MGELFVYFDPNEINVIKICLCTNEVVIYGKEKSAKAM